MAVPISYTPLEGNTLSELAPNAKGMTTFSGDTPSLFATSSFVYTLFFVSIVVAAFYRYTLAGLWRMEASQTGIKKSNDELKRVSLGLLGVFSMFLILFTVNKDLLKGDVGLSELRAKPVAGGSGNALSVNQEGNGGTDGSQVSSSETDARALLSGISFNHDPCVGSNTSKCTNVAGLRQETISMLQSLKSQCSDCNLLITGGTEGGHSAKSNHGVGKEAVDLSLTPGLKNFIESKGEKAGAMTKCDTRYRWGGFVFWDEAPDCDEITTVRHYHVSFNGR
jgi:hypothetical protein